MISGWVSPLGEFFKAEKYEHIYIAQTIVDKYYLKEFEREQFNKRTSEDQFLIDNGWIHLTNLHFFFNFIVFNLTNEQFSFIEKIFDDLDYKQKAMLSEVLNYNK